MNPGPPAPQAGILVHARPRPLREKVKQGFKTLVGYLLKLDKRIIEKPTIIGRA